MSTESNGKNERLKHINFGGVSRREFLKTTMKAGVVVASSEYMLNPSQSVVQQVAMKWGAEEFVVAYISDSHLVAWGKEHRFARALTKAVEDVNAMKPQPDFILYGGDLAQLGLRDEFSLGKEIIAPLKPKLYMMVGEHDWYYDMGEAWKEFFGKPTYSFDHKGVHFVVLNSILVEDYWSEKKMTPMERMLFMAQLDNPRGRPFTVGEEQRKWLKEDLAGVGRGTPVVVFSHSPLYKYYRPWNFWTDDAEEVQALLAPFKSVTVIHGHTHQVLTNKIKNVVFHGMLSTAWPWPYAPEGIPRLTVQMDRADPFNQFDGTGWGTAAVTAKGKIDKTYNLWDRNPMVVSYEKLLTVKEQVAGPSY